MADEAAVKREAPRVPLVWRFLLPRGWERIPDPIFRPDADWDECLKNTGFQRKGEFGCKDADCYLEVYWHQKREAFLVVVVILELYFPILVPNLPSCLALLRQLMPLVNTAIVTERQEQRRDDRELRDG